jgi:hypothetical protein
VCNYLPLNKTVIPAKAGIQPMCLPLAYRNIRILKTSRTLPHWILFTAGSPPEPVPAEAGGGDDRYFFTCVTSFSVSFLGK